MQKNTMSANIPNLLIASFKNKIFAPHFHDNYSIALITHGEHTFTCNKEVYQAKVGDIRLINPGDIHVCNSKEWGYITFTPDSNFVKTFSDQSHFIRVFNKIFGMSPKKLMK
jgi:hypothetical protein